MSKGFGVNIRCLRNNASRYYAMQTDCTGVFKVGKHRSSGADDNVMLNITDNVGC